MAKQLYKVVHVEFETPYMGKKHWYFGSAAAIYEHVPESKIGIKLESLWNVNLESEYTNRLVTIRQGVLKRKPKMEILTAKGKE